MTTSALPPEAASTSSSDQIRLSDTDRSRLPTCIHIDRTSAHFAEGGVDAAPSERPMRMTREARSGR